MSYLKEVEKIDKEDISYSYISRQPCGCLGMAVVDNPEHRRDVAKEVAKAIRCGEIVEGVTSDYVRKGNWYCPKHMLEMELDKTTGKQLPLEK